MAPVDSESTPLVKVTDSEPSGCGDSPLCNPRSRLHRYVALIFICFLSFGSYYCYDNPAALEKEIERDLQKKTSEYVLLYSLYSYPNVILCFIGGYLIDRVFGIRLGTMIFSTLVTIGQVVFAFGAFTHKYFVMETGRFIFGLGGENLAVCQNAYSVAWFKGNELNMVFGLQLSFSRIGSTVNMNVNHHIYDFFSRFYAAEYAYKALGLTLFVGVGICLFSWLCGAIIGLLDRRATKILHKEDSTTGEVISLKDVKDFPATLWLIFIICVAYYVAIFPFVGLGLLLFEEKFGFTPNEAGLVNSIVFIISAAASPFLGFVVDKTGKNVFWVLLAIILSLAAHGMVAFTFWNPFVAMSVLGVAYSLLACALWPLVSLVVPEYQLGTAYGFMQSIQNLGLAVITQVAGIIVDKQGYLVLEIFFCAWLCVALIATIFLYLVDASKGGALNLSTAERNQIAAQSKVGVKSLGDEESVRSEDSFPGISPVVPRSAAQLRMRFLSRVGQQYFQIPESHRSHALAYPHVLK
ncbi:major facilitator superfamily domain-containing protein 1 [Exaiptasia diaphana]|uniref:Lysosomal dipeptide transporter MFSD1 n=1 Tax=Exaiptasia diaphana TaxID=2652724 RepID=A0A913X6J0_EXADI|nr:major facilitator superfamily domain-containing protein 1 [Exaiptasia diaphana]KXJ15043.1 Major facilitator superfamily domain-containing protein 1 [Exaiptasia diaphana]